MSKQPICPICGTPFVKYRSTQKVCGPSCAMVYADQKAKEKADKEWKRETKRMKDELLDGDKKHWMEKTKTACHLYIRARDKDDPCISCGKMDAEIPDVFVGGKWDAGHFRTKGAAPELRFHPLNIHKQCKSCNAGSGKFAKKNHTVSMEYEKRLRIKIGDKMVDWLKGPHIAQKWTIEDLKDIRDYYKELTRELRKTAVQTEIDS